MELYRYERRSADYFQPRISLEEFEVLSETPKGYWINIYHFFNDRKMGMKWVSKTGKKRFAYPTKEEALESFRARTSRCIKILTARLEDAKQYDKAALIEFDKFEKLNTKENDNN